MVDTPGDLAAIQAKWPDNTTGDISPQDVRDGLQSFHPETFGFFNVMNYGAEGDDATDDTTAFDNAITAADNAGGGIVWIPAGTYRVSTISVTKRVSFSGIGAGRSKVKGAGTGNEIFNINHNDQFGQQRVFYRDFSIVGDATSETDGEVGRFGIKMAGASSHTFEGMSFYNLGDSAINTYNSASAVDVGHHVYFRDCAFSPVAGAALNNRPIIDITAPCNGWSWENIFFIGSINWFGSSLPLREIADVGAIHLRSHPLAGNASSLFDHPNHMMFRHIRSQSVEPESANSVFMRLEDVQQVTVEGLQLWDNSGANGRAAILVENPNSLADYKRNGHRLMAISNANSSWAEYAVELDNADRCYVQVPTGSGVKIGAGSRFNVVEEYGGDRTVTSNWDLRKGIEDLSTNDTNVIHALSVGRDVLNERRGAWMPPKHDENPDWSDSLVKGMMYYNTTSNELRHYNGTAWAAV